MTKVNPLGNALWTHLRTGLKLNLRNTQALVFGYAMPVVFLIAFGSVFKGGDPSLKRSMAQLLTISVLGGACFGLPVGMVTDRERGLWRLYRLTPMPTSLFVGSVLLGRFLLVGSSGLMQYVLAMLLYHTPLPAHPVLALIGFSLVSFALLGLGLVIAQTASSAAAVQALGQCIFLPMIIFGGVGVPLLALPVWARHLSAFLPGRYAVDILAAAMTGHASNGVGFDVFALVSTGCAGSVAAWKLFRWEPRQALPRDAWMWILVAVAAWAVVGLAAEWQGIASHAY